jgi:putative redox protein
MTSALKTILDGTASAIADDPSLAEVRLAADCELVGVHEVDVRTNGGGIKSDQPPMLGGDGLGPNPMEIALAALGSCQAQTYRFWSEKLGIRIDDVTVDIAGDVDVHGIFGLRDTVRPGFGDVTVSVHLTGPETAARYEELRRAVDAHCPVLDVFTNPVPVTTTLSVR